jgi:hypothetical protein
LIFMMSQRDPPNYLAEDNAVSGPGGRRIGDRRTGEGGAPAVRGYLVCRMHGAGGGAPIGKPNGNYKHDDLE